MITGAVAVAVTIMLSSLVSLPPLFAALTEKMLMPTVVGIPDIVAPDSDSPAGSEPLTILHVSGALPIASSVWLYCEPT